MGILTRFSIYIQKSDCLDHSNISCGNLKPHLHYYQRSSICLDLIWSANRCVNVS